ncbi:MAG: DUF6521 family protein [Gammaproteobacteria bacterium]|nr:DUF6521 family protein [Gammaproteobacteria bacterium]
MADETRWSVPWAARPAEEARIFNPAFCGELLGRTVSEYHRTRQATVSIVTVFLVLPLTLHRPTREALPGRANTAFAGWVAEHSALLAELPDRARRLRPVSREALLFALRHQLLALQGGDLIPGAKPVRRSARPTVSTAETTAARSAAALLGRWFAGQHTQTSILHGMGIAP